MSGFYGQHLAVPRGSHPGQSPQVTLQRVILCGCMSQREFTFRSLGVQPLMITLSVTQHWLLICPPL